MVGGAAGQQQGAGGSVSTFLSEWCELEGTENGWGPVEKDLSNGEDLAGDGGPLTINGKTFSRGLGVHAPSSIAYNLAGQCSSLSATVGVDDEMRANAAVVFQVWGDGTRLYESDTLTFSSDPVPVEVDVTGVQELRLVVSEQDGNGSDHADWADVRVTCTTAATTLCPRPEPPQVVPPSGYRLVWSDEFSTEGRPDPNNWTFERGFARNEELQWYQPDNAWVQAGFLIIEGRRERVENPNYRAGSSDWKTSRQYAEYTSSSLLTRGLQEFQYGLFQLRARIVASGGLWPAWWTLGKAGEWPSNGEIDIMEFYGGSVRANVACGTTTRWQARWDSASRPVSGLGRDWDAKFHVWEMEWDQQTITLSLDGEVLNTTALSDMLNPDGNSPFQQAHYMLVNLAIGGTAGGDPSGAVFPSHYEVDYVRVFARE